MKNNVWVWSFLILLPLQLWSKDIKVGKDGQFATIKEALAYASAGDRILVDAGTYQESPILIDKSVVLEGIGQPVLDGEGEHEVIRIQASEVQVRGFRISNVAVSYVEDRAAIKVQQSKYVIIENNVLENTFFGIYLAKSKKCTVSNNQITGSGTQETNAGNAIHLWYCDSITVKHNKVAKHRDGIYLEFANNTLVENNISTKNLRYGLHFMFSHYNWYIKNTFEDNGAGVAVMYSRNIDMVENRFLNNWGEIAHGLLLKDITDSQIKSNVFTSNTIGIYAEGSNRISVTDNHFEKNGWALKVLGNCEGNVFSKNNFIANTFDVTTNSASNHNTFTENFWSAYRGYDLNQDGVGDVPHRPVALFTYLLERIPSSIVLLRSSFVDLLNLAEKVTPMLTPVTLIDEKPLMKRL